MPTRKSKEAEAAALRALIAKSVAAKKPRGTAAANLCLIYQRRLAELEKYLAQGT